MQSVKGERTETFLGFFQIVAEHTSARVYIRNSVWPRLSPLIEQPSAGFHLLNYSLGRTAFPYNDLLPDGSCKSFYNHKE